jgi:endonuclease YncB( thermonuclease family)
MTPRKFIVAACLIFSGCESELGFFAGNALGDEITGTVTRVVDGDTIHVAVGLTKHVIRLSEIDTPERDQPWGRQASRALAEKLNGGRVTVLTTEMDRYGRLIGKVLFGSRDINREMVREGHAWVYRQYMRDRSLLEDERTARRLKVGLWGSDHPIEPWRWRRGTRASLAPTVQADNENITGPGPLIGGLTPEKILVQFGYRGAKGASQDQIKGYKRVFGLLDLDRNKKLSVKEYVDDGRYMDRQARAGIFLASDANHDATVTEAEYIENRIITDEAKQIFRSMDADSDGRVRRQEMLKHGTINDANLADAVFTSLDIDANGELVIPEYLRVWGSWARH